MGVLLPSKLAWVFFHVVVTVYRSGEVDSCGQDQKTDTISFLLHSLELKRSCASPCPKDREKYSTFDGSCYKVLWPFCHLSLAC